MVSNYILCRSEFCSDLTQCCLELFDRIGNFFDCAAKCRAQQGQELPPRQRQRLHLSLWLDSTCRRTPFDECLLMWQCCCHLLHCRLTLTTALLALNCVRRTCTNYIRQPTSQSHWCSGYCNLLRPDKSLSPFRHTFHSTRRQGEFFWCTTAACTSTFDTSCRHFHTDTADSPAQSTHRPPHIARHLPTHSRSPECTRIRRNNHPAPWCCCASKWAALDCYSAPQCTPCTDTPCTDNILPASHSSHHVTSSRHPEQSHKRRRLHCACVCHSGRRAQFLSAHVFGVKLIVFPISCSTLHYHHHHYRCHECFCYRPRWDAAAHLILCHLCIWFPAQSFQLYETDRLCVSCCLQGSRHFLIQDTRHLCSLLILKR